MLRTTMVLLMLVSGIPAAALLHAADATVETTHLVVSDKTGRLSRAELQKSADEAQETLNRVLAFWSSDAGIERLGKIRVVFDKPRRHVYSCVFYWDRKGDQRIRVVEVFGTEGTPQMLAHKLTSAVFPQKDKLIRNMMGILTEAQVGSPLTFPMCGFSADEWTLAFVEMKTYIPLNRLGPDHDSWGMKDGGGGALSILDHPKQHKGYAEAGSFGDYLFHTYGINKIKQLQRLSQEKDRPWQEAFGAGLQELEASWLKALKESGKTNAKNVSTLLRLFEKNPGTACAEAQKLRPGNR